MNAFLGACRYYFGHAFFFSMFINVLQLTFSVYMLQIYDRVLSSYSVPTLAVITLAALIALTALAGLDWVRGRLLVRAGIELDARLSLPVLRRNLALATGPVGAQNAASLRDVQSVRTFLSGNSVFAFFDIPWMPLFFGLLFVLHPALGGVALAGGVLVFFMSWLTQRITAARLDKANEVQRKSSDFLAAAFRNAHAVTSMGMTGNIASRWQAFNDEVIELQTRASGAAGLLHSISRSMRMAMQVLIYAVGAYLTVTHRSTAGIMIAASIIMGRALAPLDQAMAAYRQSLEAWAAYKRLKSTLNAPEGAQPMRLPDPEGRLAVESVTFAAQGRQLLGNVSFLAEPGSTVALIGSSGSGKTSLCKVLLGQWKPLAGKVRIDGADISSWDSEALGAFIGYLPQEVELFAGTIADNIARMGVVDSDKVIEAARRAGVHQLILALPAGYDTFVGERGSFLSGGQRQRIGLARALYGDPRIVILDEPDSSLDAEGESGLLQVVADLKQRKATVVLVSHKTSFLALVDSIVCLQNGHVVLSGPRQEVLGKLSEVRKREQSALRQQEEIRKRHEALERFESKAS